MKKNILTCLLLMAVVASHATVTLPAIFGNNMILQQKSTVPIWGWTAPGSNVSLSTSWNKKSYKVVADASGKWKLMVTTPAAGGPFTIQVSDGDVVKLDNVLIGEVWLCSGQSNMEMPMHGFAKAKIKDAETTISNAANKNIRLFTVKRADRPERVDTCTGEWKEASPESVAPFSAVGYLYAKILQQQLKVPVGIIASSWGGTPIEAWMSEESLKPVMESKTADTKFQNRRSVLFNGMINPVIGYGIKGFLWYQGEANRTNADVYAELMAAMVNDWRNKWNQKDLPFYFVQIAPLKGNNTNPLLPRLREAQWNALKTIPNSGMAVSIDVGEENNIHPADKPTVAQRLSSIALAKTYGRRKVTYSGPVFKQMQVIKDTVNLSFDFAQNGLVARDNQLKLFEVAGDDKVFYPAEAGVRKSGVWVSSSSVPHPVAVRYAYKDWVVGDLYNKEGLPATSFRTDNW